MMNRDAAINRVLNMKNVNTDDLLDIMENGGMIFDYLDMPYSDGTYKTEEQKRQNIIEDFMNLVMDIQESRSEYFDDTEWTVKRIKAMIEAWDYAVKNKWIEPEDSWEE